MNTSLPASDLAIEELRRCLPARKMRRTEHLAIGQLFATPINELQEICSDSHKDFYGVRGRWMLTTASKTTLISWFLDHYTFDVDRQIWVNRKPFTGEEE